MASRGCADTGRRKEIRRRAARRSMRRLVPVLLLAATPLRAQVESIATVAPALSPVGIWRTTASEPGAGALANSLTLRLNAGGTQTIPSLTDNRINAFSSPVNVTTEWQSATTISVVDLVGYFANPVAALSGPAYDIPSGRLLGRMLSGSAPSFSSFTGNAIAGVGTPGATLHLFRQSIIAPVNGVGQRTDDLELQLDLRGLPNLPAGTYSGTLTLRAVAY